MATAESRAVLRRYLEVQEDVDDNVIQILLDALTDIGVQLDKLEDGNAIRRVQAEAAMIALLKRLVQAFSQIESEIERGSAQAALTAVQANGKFDPEFLRKMGLVGADAKDFQLGLERSAERAVQLAINRNFDQEGKTNRKLSERVYRSRQLSEGYVRRKVNSALARGLSAKEFANDVKDLIDPDVRGGISYAAMRLARTELNNAFHYSQIKNAQDKPWITGMKWHTSGSHPDPDVCDALAAEHSEGRDPGVYNKDAVPDKPHPQCLCHLTPVSMSPEEFEKTLDDFDSSTPKTVNAELAEGLDEPSPVRSAPKMPKRTPKKRSKNKDVNDQRKTNSYVNKTSLGIMDKSEKAKIRAAIEKQAAGKVNIRMSAKNLLSVLNDGRIKSVYEVLNKDADYLKIRKSYEDDIMGIEGLEPEERPIYGYLGEPDEMTSYGDYAITLKSEVKNRITVSIGDSLNGMLDVYTPEEVVDIPEKDWPTSIGRHDLGAGGLETGKFKQYMEAQIFGGVSIADIDYVTVPSDTEQSVLDALESAGIRVEVELTEEERILEEARKALGLL